MCSRCSTDETDRRRHEICAMFFYVECALVGGECNCTSVEPGLYGTEFLTLQFLLYVHRSTKGIITRSLLFFSFGDRLGDRIG